jgi:hypothetical protein
VAVGGIFTWHVNHREDGDRNWDRILAGRGTSVAEACAEWREGVARFGQGEYEMLIVGVAGALADEQRLALDWVEFADARC